MQLIEEAAVLHERVHQRALAAVGAVADEREQVGVPDAAQHVDLRAELLLALQAETTTWQVTPGG